MITILDVGQLAEFLSHWQNENAHIHSRVYPPRRRRTGKELNYPSVVSNYTPYPCNPDPQDSLIFQRDTDVQKNASRCSPCRSSLNQVQPLSYKIPLKYVRTRPCESALMHNPPTSTDLASNPPTINWLAAHPIRRYSSKRGKATWCPITKLVLPPIAKALSPVCLF